MRLAQILGPDLKATLADPEALHRVINEAHPEDFAQYVEELSDEDAVALMRALPAGMAATVTERLSAEKQVVVLEGMRTEHAVSMLSEMAPDDRVDAVQALPMARQSQIMQLLEKQEPEAAEEVRELGAWGEKTAGGLMTTEFVGQPPETKVWQAIDEVRRLSHEGRAEIVHYIYVTAYGDKLVGVVSLRDLILADSAQELQDIMTTEVVRVVPQEDQENVAETIAKYDLSAVPVVDINGSMLGVVTVDDVVDVLRQEATEDAQKMGAVLPLEDSYLQTGFFAFVRKRAAWLVVLFLGQLLSAEVLKEYEVALRTTMGLVVFLPTIVGSGGNSGAQSATLIIRALSGGEILPGDWWRVMLRELAMGLVLGVFLGALGLARVWLQGGDDANIQLAIAVSLSVVAVVTVGTLVGSLLPLGMKRIGFDPALSSTPFISSLVDVLGLLVYLGIASVILQVAL